jgi:hypothetical protein
MTKVIEKYSTAIRHVEHFSSPFIKKNFSILHHPSSKRILYGKTFDTSNIFHHPSSKRIFQFFITLHQKEFYTVKLLTHQTFFITLHQKEFLYSEHFDVTDGKVIE